LAYASRLTFSVSKNLNSPRIQVGVLKMEDQKMQGLKMQDQMLPHENEGPNDGA